MYSSFLLLINRQIYSIKVSSTETGVIFGSILWESPNMSESCVILNDIHIDIMDYIKPAYCTEAQVYQVYFLIFVHL
jgi:vesicle coat complex subunit